MRPGTLPERGGLVDWGSTSGSLHAVGSPVSDRRYPLLAWAVLWFTVAVILGGSVVRATGSGAGCGESWPQCEGSIFPLSGTTETAIEFTHRAMSLVAGLALVAFLVWTLRITRRGAPVRGALAWTAAFFVGEVAIGAMLVVFGWVEDDSSLGRLIVVPVHLVNTLFLLGAMTRTAHFAGGGVVPRLGGDRQRDMMVLGGIGVLLVVAATGALNALADTLFPADTFLEGLREEFGPTAPFLVRLRVVHPLIAIAGAFTLLLLVRHPAFDPDRRAARPIAAVIAIVAAQIVIGIVNVAMATPTEIQVVHLFAANALWVAFALASIRVLAPSDTGVPESTEVLG